MGKHQHYYGNEEEIREAFDKGIDSGNLSTRFDEDWMTSQDDLFEEWKYETFRYSKDDLDWDHDGSEDD